MAARKTTPSRPHVLNPRSLAAAVADLCALEPAFTTVVQAHGLPALRKMPDGLHGLLAIVTDQFLSVRAAAAIWARVLPRLSPLAPETVLSTPQEELVRLGLSRAKAKSFHGIAKAILTKTCDLAMIAKHDDESAQRELVRLPGVGPWTAQIYLLSALQRADIWPAGDLALQRAAQDLFTLSERPQGKAMMALGMRFVPYRAVAARLLWSHYRGLKGLNQEGSGL